MSKYLSLVSLEEIEQAIKEAKHTNRFDIYGCKSVKYIPNSSKYECGSYCREEAFGDLRSGWRSNFEDTPEKSWSIRVRYPSLKADRTYNVHTGLALVEKHLNIETNQFRIFLVNKDSIEVEYLLATEWRHHPAMVFLVLQMLRSAMTPIRLFSSFSNRPTLVAVKKFGLYKVFPKEHMMQRLRQGHYYDMFHGNAHFTKYELKNIVSKLESSETS